MADGPRFVKEYSNYTGRRFRRYEWHGRTVDIKVRDSRNGMYLMTNAEAKLEAIRRLR